MAGIAAKVKAGRLLKEAKRVIEWTIQDKKDNYSDWDAFFKIYVKFINEYLSVLKFIYNSNHFRILRKTQASLLTKEYKLLYPQPSWILLAPLKVVNEGSFLVAVHYIGLKDSDSYNDCKSFEYMILVFLCLTMFLIIVRKSFVC